MLPVTSYPSSDWSELIQTRTTLINASIVPNRFFSWAFVSDYCHYMVSGLQTHVSNVVSPLIPLSIALSRNCNTHLSKQGFSRLKINFTWHPTETLGLLLWVWEMKSFSYNIPGSAPSKSLIIHNHPFHSTLSSWYSVVKQLTNQPTHRPTKGITSQQRYNA